MASDFGIERASTGLDCTKNAPCGHIDWLHAGAGAEGGGVCCLVARQHAGQSSGTKHLKQFCHCDRRRGRGGRSLCRLVARQHGGREALQQGVRLHPRAAHAHRRWHRGAQRLHYPPARLLPARQRRVPRHGVLPQVSFTMNTPTNTPPWAPAATATAVRSLPPRQCRVPRRGVLHQVRLHLNVKRRRNATTKDDARCFSCIARQRHRSCLTKSRCTSTGWRVRSHI